VQYYFQLQLGTHVKTVALVSRYTDPNQELLRLSHGTLYSSYYLGTSALQVIDVSRIKTVVAMVEHQRPEEYKEINMGERKAMFLVEKMGLGFTQEEESQENSDEDE